MNIFRTKGRTDGRRNPGPRSGTPYTRPGGNMRRSVVRGRCPLPPHSNIDYYFSGTRKWSHPLPHTAAVRHAQGESEIARDPLATRSRPSHNHRPFWRPFYRPSTGRQNYNFCGGQVFPPETHEFLSGKPARRSSGPLLKACRRVSRRACGCGIVAS